VLRLDFQPSQATLAPEADEYTKYMKINDKVRNKLRREAPGAADFAGVR
jgi:hypothetical protein